MDVVIGHERGERRVACVSGTRNTFERSDNRMKDESDTDYDCYEGVLKISFVDAEAMVNVPVRGKALDASLLSSLETPVRGVEQPQSIESYVPHQQCATVVRAWRASRRHVYASHSTVRVAAYVQVMCKFSWREFIVLLQTNLSDARKS